MPKYKDIVGLKFGRLLVLKLWDKTKNQKYRWICRCECGKECVAIGSDMASGKHSSCGCLKHELSVSRMKAQATKHGLAYTNVYRAWKGVIQRCYNKNSKDYCRYGAIGITPCEGIRASVINLIAAIGDRPHPGLSVDRVDNKHGYWCGACYECVSKGRKLNLRWANDFQQCRNQKSNRIIEFQGQRKCLSEWAESKGIPSGAIAIRIDRLGWSTEDALTKPLRRMTRKH